MKRIALIALSILLVTGATAQSTSEDRNISKAERKAARAEARRASQEAMDAQYEVANKALNELNFLVKFDRLFLRQGGSISLTPQTNFLSVTGNKATIQIIGDPTAFGPNGLGGITLEGQISGITISTSKKGITYFEATVNGHSLSATIKLTLSRNGNLTRADIIPTFRNNRIALEGILQPFDATEVFKGKAS